VIQRHPDKPFIEIQRFFKVSAEWVQYGTSGHLPEIVAHASQDKILHEVNQEFPVSLRGNVLAPSKAELEKQCAVAMKARGIVPQPALSIAGGEAVAVGGNTA
jgi:predicted HAD superfamily hydrolase